MTEIPEHLLQRSAERRKALGLPVPGEEGGEAREAAARRGGGARGRRAPAEAPAAAAAAAGAPAATIAEAASGGVPAHLLERSKRRRAAARRRRRRRARPPAAAACGRAAARDRDGAQPAPTATGPGGHTQRLLTVVKSGSIQQTRAEAQDKVHIWPHLLVVEFAAVLVVTAALTGLLGARARTAARSGRLQPDAEPVEGAVVLPRPAGAADDVPPDGRGRDHPGHGPRSCSSSRPTSTRTRRTSPTDRKFAISIFTIFLMFWAVLVIIGSFFRGRASTSCSRGTTASSSSCRSVVPVAIVNRAIVVRSCCPGGRRDRGRWPSPRSTTGRLSRETRRRDEAASPHVPPAPRRRRAAPAPRLAEPTRPRARRPAARRVRAARSSPRARAPSIRARSTRRSSGSAAASSSTGGSSPGSASASAAFGAATLGFLWPRRRRLRRQGRRRLRSPTPRPRSTRRSRTTTPAARTYIVAYPKDDVPKAKKVRVHPVIAGMEQGYVALYQKCVHLGCRVPWCADVAVVRVPVPRLEVQPGRREAGWPGAPGPRPLPARGRRAAASPSTPASSCQGPPIGTDTTGQSGRGGALCCEVRTAREDPPCLDPDPRQPGRVRARSASSSCAACSACGGTRSRDRRRT